MSERPRKLTAVIACYRDAQAVPFMYQRLVAVFGKIGVDYEIIFVNDASPDNAREVLGELAGRDRKVIVINHSRNYGSQSAFTSGMMIASGDAVILLDGDLQDPPELIEEFYRKWREGFDVVYGVRTKREAAPFMRVAYKAFYRLFRAASYVPIPLDAGDFSLIDRRVVAAINSLPENNRFLRGLRTWVGFRQTGVPYLRPERMFGVTTNSLLGNIGWAKKAIFSFSYLPLSAISWLSGLMVVLALLGGMTQFIIRLVRPDATPSGFTTLILIACLIGGVQMLCLAIIGGYLEHIYDEVKRRPAYIVESYLNYPPAAIPGPAPVAGEPPSR